MLVHIVLGKARQDLTASEQQELSAAIASLGDVTGGDGAVLTVTLTYQRLDTATGLPLPCAGSAIVGPSGPTGPTGGTGPTALRVSQKSELITALTNVLKLINSQTRSFAAAAVPSVQTNAADKVILSNFTPINKPSMAGRKDRRAGRTAETPGSRTR